MIKIKYNVKHAIKVQKLYNAINTTLLGKKIYGIKRVIERHKEMLKALSIGLMTTDEYKQWKLSQKMI
jgi:hypothetical protein